MIRHDLTPCSIANQETRTRQAKFEQAMFRRKEASPFALPGAALDLDVAVALWLKNTLK